jgi:hypothetical protein
VLLLLLCAQRLWWAMCSRAMLTLLHSHLRNRLLLCFQLLLLLLDSRCMALGTLLLLQCGVNRICNHHRSTLRLIFSKLLL